jgi:hypothetical protein
VGREGTGTKQSVCLHTAFLRKGISRDEWGQGWPCTVEVKEQNMQKGALSKKLGKVCRLFGTNCFLIGTFPQLLGIQEAVSKYWLSEWWKLLMGGNDNHSEEKRKCDQDRERRGPPQRII